MNSVLRSKHGCWTCRLRRKKCDEKHPFCSTCESLTVTCYGYGSKPDWMDGGEREKAMANSIKQIVKKTSRQKGRLGMSMSRLQGRQKDDGVAKIAPKSTYAETDRHLSVRADGNAEHTPSSGENDSPGNSSGFSGPSPASTEQTASQGSQGTLSWLSAIKNDEAILLMHFIDIVFPLQYPMYRPSIENGGRGWLLYLLLRTKPLYHASLALSAFHRGAFFRASSLECSNWSIVEKDKHFALCLSEFQRSIKDVTRYVDCEHDLCPSNSLGLMACVIQLVFFELFAGHAETWQIHLHASTDVFCRGYWILSKKLGFIDSPDEVFDRQRTQVAQENRSRFEDLGTFTFLSGVTIWLDIVSCITTGKSPRLLSFHPHAISSTSNIKMESIMGCRNWSVLQIGRITALQNYKMQALQQGCLDTAGFGCRAQDIEQDLRYAFTESSLASLEVSSDSNYAAQGEPALHPEICIITHIFNLTASLYLHLVVHGYQLEMQEVRSTIEEAMIMLRKRMPTRLLHAIICPLYIIGSAAKEEDKQFFRYIFTSLPVLDPSLVHRGKILPILEDIWHMRCTTLTGWTWQDSVRLSDHDLLLL